MNYSFIYAVGQMEGGEPKAVKIGITSNINTRMASLKTGSPYRLELLGISLLKHPAMERAAHEFLKDHRLEGEWCAHEQRDGKVDCPCQYYKERK